MKVILFSKIYMSEYGNEKDHINIFSVSDDDNPAFGVLES